MAILFRIFYVFNYNTNFIWTVFFQMYRITSWDYAIDNDFLNINYLKLQVQTTAYSVYDF